MPDKKIINVDSQVINAVQLCARKVEYGYVGVGEEKRKLAPQQKEEYFDKGDIIHKIQAHYYNLRKDSPSMPHVEKVKESIEMARKYSASLDLAGEECELILDHAEENLNFWEHDGWQPIAIEQVATKIIYEDDNYQFLYTGKIDLIIEMAAFTPPILPVDHKSSGRRHSPTQLSNQFMGYCWLLGTKNLIVNQVGLQKTVPAKDKYQRPVLSYTQEMIDEWVENTIWWIQMLMHHIETGHFPMNLTSCDKYGGCIFQALCTSDPRNREYKALRDYRAAEDWDPSKELK